MAQRQADRDGKTLQEMIPAAELKELQSQESDEGHPKFHAPTAVKSWSAQWNAGLDLKDSALWESKIEDRQTGVVTWENIQTKEIRRVKPSSMVTKSDIAWRYTIGNVQEFYKERTIQSYRRKIWDHGVIRSTWGKKGPPKKKGGVGINVSKTGGDDEDEDDTLDEDDPNYVGPWEEEEEGVDEMTGEIKIVYVRRKGKAGEGGEIMEKLTEKPTEMMTEVEINAIAEEQASKIQAEKDAKKRKIEMEVAKAARERAKKRKRKK